MWEEIKEDTAWGQIEKCLSKFPEEPIGGAEKLDLKNIDAQNHNKYFDVYCENCGKEKEVFQNSDEDFPLCETCNTKMKRLFSKFSFKLIYNNKKDVCG